MRARGAYLWDDTGRQYLDMLAGYGVFNIGRNHPVVARVADALARTGVAVLVPDSPRSAQGASAGPRSTTKGGRGAAG